MPDPLNAIIFIVFDYFNGFKVPAAMLADIGASDRRFPQSIAI
jgi:hypothetical protein